MKLFALLLSFLIPSNGISEYQYATTHVLITQKESRRKIAVIDTGIKITENVEPFLCLGRHYDLTGTGILDTHGHGTNVAGLIARSINPKRTCLLIIKYFNDGKDSIKKEMEAIEIALKEEVSFINLSSGGEGHYPVEYETIKKVISKGVYFVAAAGNKNEDLQVTTCNYFPACYNFLSPLFRVVGNGSSPQKRHPSSNYGIKVTDWRNGVSQTGFGITLTGSSQSAAILTGELAGKE